MQNNKYPKLVGILKNNESNNMDNWVKACKDLKINYKEIDICSNGWLDEILSEYYDFFVHLPPSRYEYTKNMFDERMYIISKVIGHKIFPNFEETIIYENKKMLSYFLKTKNIPHPDTFIFYEFSEALDFINNYKYPLVAKTSIGASGSGVKILENKSSALAYIKSAFKGKGIHRRIGPNRVIGNPGTWLRKALTNPKYLKNRLTLYFEMYKNVQKNYVIFQEYINHEYEWRVIKIGDSYFAHKKVKINEMASGTKQKVYDNPPLDILNFVKNICDKTNFNSQSIDIFKDSQRGYLVNEVQTIFGQSDPFQMKVNGKIGRYIYNNGWIFEEGDFIKNECFNLRLITALDQFGYKTINYRDI